MTDTPRDVWPDDADSEDRVRSVADALTRPRSASWVAEQADVTFKTAQKYLAKGVEDGRLETTERDRTTCYYPDPRDQFLGEIGDLVQEYTKDELTAELESISERIETWQDTYDVNDPNALRASLDESLSVAERRERERVVEDWEYTREMRTLIRHAIRLYDDLTRVSGSPAGPIADA